MICETAIVTASMPYRPLTDEELLTYATAVGKHSSPGIKITMKVGLDLIRQLIVEGPVEKIEAMRAIVAAFPGETNGPRQQGAPPADREGDQEVQPLPAP